VSTSNILAKGIRIPTPIFGVEGAFATDVATAGPAVSSVDYTRAIPATSIAELPQTRSHFVCSVEMGLAPHLQQIYVTIKYMLAIC
jgi:hypothetical protein